MRAISKQELLKMLDKALPDNAQISATSVIAGEAFEVTQDLINELVPSLVDVELTGAEEETLPGATHVMYVP